MKKKLTGLGQRHFLDLWTVRKYLSVALVFMCRVILIKIRRFSIKIQPVLVLDGQFSEFYLFDASILFSHLRQTFMVFGTVIAPYHFIVKWYTKSKILFSHFKIFYFKILSHFCFKTGWFLDIYSRKFVRKSPKSSISPRFRLSKCSRVSI